MTRIRIRKPETKPRVKPCIDCPTMVTKKAKRCAPCNRAYLASDPAIRAKRSQSVSAFFRNNPDKARENARRAAAARMAKPENREVAIATMRAIQRLSWTPEALARRDQAARVRAAEEGRMAWCPKEYRPLYRQLMNTRGIRKAEAVIMVRQQIVADIKRAKPTAPRAPEPQLSPFERQMLALERGASLQDNVRLDRHSDSAAELRAKLA